MATVVRTPEGNASIPITADGTSVSLDGDVTIPTGDLTVTAGAVAVGVAAADASALVDITSTTQGLLLPRMTTAERDAISAPASGLLVYNTTTNKLNFRAAAAWEAITSA